MKKKKSIQEKEHNQQFSVQTSYCLSVPVPMVIPLTFIFLSCHEKARDNKEI